MIKSRKNSNVLIADDSVTNSLLIKGILEAEDFSSISSVHNGKDAIKLLNSELFDLVILDIKMPQNISGIDVLKFIKSEKKLLQLPVIIVSANNNESEIDECYALGAHVYLHKPLNIETFTNILNELFS